MILELDRDAEELFISRESLRRELVSVGQTTRQ